MKNLLFMVIIIGFTQVLNAQQSSIIINRKNNAVPVKIATDSLQQISFTLWAPCVGTPFVDYAGKKYNTIQIGNRCWLKENMDVGKMISGDQLQINYFIIEKYCYNNDTANCSKYGGLYNWNEAMQYVTAERAQGICPQGWHIPTNAEFDSLRTAVKNNGNSLKEVGQGREDGIGTNTSGFSALIAGAKYLDSRGFYDLGKYTFFWSSSPLNSLSSNNLRMSYYDSGVGVFSNDKSNAFSIRCIKDDERIPEIPIQEFPSNGMTQQPTSLQFSWSSSKGANSYDLQISTDSTFTSNTFGLRNLINTKFQFQGLKNNIKYYWRICAVNNYGYSFWSSIWNFITVNSDNCPGIPPVTYYGQVYNTVQIGKQCWLRENLNVGEMIKATQEQNNNGKVEKYCYDNDSANCAKYGGLYQWAEAIQYKNGATNTTSPNPAFSGNIQGICPSGWHIPSQSEFQMLQLVVDNDGNSLKAIGQGTGTNASGFSALLVGYRTIDPIYLGAGSDTGFWSTKEHYANYAYSMSLSGYRSDVIIGYGRKPYGLSVRCLKDN